MYYSYLLCRFRTQFKQANMNDLSCLYICMYDGGDKRKHNGAIRK